MSGVARLVSAAADTSPAELDELAALEAAWADDRDLYRVLLTGRSTRVRGRVWYLSNAGNASNAGEAVVGSQLIWDYRRYRSVAAAREDCARLIKEEQARHAGGRPAAVTWINRVRRARRRRGPDAGQGGAP